MVGNDYSRPKQKWTEIRPFGGVARKIGGDGDEAMGSGVYPHWGWLTPPLDVFDETDSRDGRSPILEIYFGEPSILFRLVLHQLAIFPIKATIRRPPPGTGLGTFTMCGASNLASNLAL